MIECDRIYIVADSTEKLHRLVKWFSQDGYVPTDSEKWHIFFDIESYGQEMTKERKAQQ